MKHTSWSRLFFHKKTFLPPCSQWNITFLSCLTYVRLSSASFLLGTGPRWCTTSHNTHYIFISLLQHALNFRILFWVLQVVSKLLTFLLEDFSHLFSHRLFSNTFPSSLFSLKHPCSLKMSYKNLQTRVFKVCVLMLALSNLRHLHKWLSRLPSVTWFSNHMILRCCDIPG